MSKLMSKWPCRRGVGFQQVVEGIWLRGKDLNLRPLGYEFDLCFVFFHAVPCVSMTYSILLALGSSCFGLLFLGSGSTFGSNTSTRFPCDCRAIRAVRFWSTTDDPTITSTGLNVQLSRLSSPRYLGSEQEFVETPNWRALGRLTPAGIFSA